MDVLFVIVLSLVFLTVFVARELGRAKRRSQDREALKIRNRSLGDRSSSEACSPRG